MRQATLDGLPGAAPIFGLALHITIAISRTDLMSTSPMSPSWDAASQLTMSWAQMYR